MKTNIKFITALFIGMMTIGLYGCKDDLSSLDTDKLPDVSVDTTGQSILSIFQFDTLNISPKVIVNDLQGHELSYTWSLNKAPRSLDTIVIGHEKDLSYPVSFAPTLPNSDHHLQLTITDTHTGIKYFQDWPLTIRNGLGEGLVIVETFDQSTTDFSHIMDPLVTPDYQATNVRQRIFSAVNGFTIPGLVSEMVYTRYGADNMFIGSTADHIYGISSSDYSLQNQDRDFFYVDQPSYGGYSFIGGFDQNDIFIKEGKIHSSWLQLSKIGLPHANNYVVPGIVSLNAYYSYYDVRLTFYSEELGQFIFLPSFASFGDRVMRPVPSSTSHFNPTAVPQKLNVAAAVNNEGDFIHLLRDKSTQKFELYILDRGGYDSNTWEVIAPKPKRYVDLSAAPEIDQAVHFVFLDDQQVLLYATATKVYAAMYSASTPSYGVRYTAAAGEEITSLRTYYQADYPKRFPDAQSPYFERNGKQLILSTYNGSEGKLSILPLINPGLANIDQANVKTFDGFGKILFTLTQL